MVELSASTNEEIIAELVGRENFDGAVVTATLGTGSDLDRATASFPDHVADHNRQNVILTAAREHLEQFGPTS